MAISPPSLLKSTVNFEGMDRVVVETREMLKTRRKLKLKRRMVKSRRVCRKVLMKRRRPVVAAEGGRRPENAIRRRVRALKRLIPKSEGMGVEGLFRETVDYILALQTRVRVMQIMVDVLTGSDE